MKVSKNFSFVFLISFVFSAHGMNQIGYTNQNSLPLATEEQYNSTFDSYGMGYAQQLEKVKNQLNSPDQNDQRVARKILNLLSKQGQYPPAKVLKADLAFQSKNTKNGFEWLNQAVEKGHSSAQELWADIAFKNNWPGAFQAMSDAAQPRNVFNYYGIPQSVYYNISAVCKLANIYAENQHNPTEEAFRIVNLAHSLTGNIKWKHLLGGFYQAVSNKLLEESEYAQQQVEKITNDSLRNEKQNQPYVSKKNRDQKIVVDEEDKKANEQTIDEKKEQASNSNNEEQKLISTSEEEEKEKQKTTETRKSNRGWEKVEKQKNEVKKEEAKNEQKEEEQEKNIEKKVEEKIENKQEPEKEKKLDPWNEFQQLCKQKETEKVQVLLKQLEKEAEDDATTAYNLSQLYKTGNDVISIDKWKVKPWLKKASELGLPQASLECADIFTSDRVPYLLDAYNQATEQKSSDLQKKAFQKLIGSAKKNISALNKVFSVYADQEELSETDAQTIIEAIVSIANSKQEKFLKSDAYNQLSQLIEKCPKEQLSSWGKKLFGLRSKVNISADVLDTCFSTDSNDAEIISMKFALEIERKKPNVELIKKSIEFIKTQKNMSEEVKNRLANTISALEPYLKKAEDLLWFAGLYKIGIKDIVAADEERALRAMKKASEYGSASASLECAQNSFDQKKFSESLNFVKKLLGQEPNENQCKDAKKILCSLVENKQLADESLFVLLGNLTDLKLEAQKVNELLERITEKDSKSFFKIADQLKKYVKESNNAPLQKKFALKILTYAKHGVQKLDQREKWQSKALKILEKEELTPELCSVLFAYYLENKNAKELLKLLERSAQIQLEAPTVNPALKYLEEKAEKDNTVAKALKQYFTNGLGIIISVDENRAQKMHQYLVKNNDIEILLETAEESNDKDKKFSLYKKAHAQAKKENNTKLSEELIEKVGKLAKEKNPRAAFYYFSELKTDESISPLAQIVEELMDANWSYDQVKEALEDFKNSGVLQDLEILIKSDVRCGPLLAFYYFTYAKRVEKDLKKIGELFVRSQDYLKKYLKKYKEDKDIKEMLANMYYGCGKNYLDLSEYNLAYIQLEQSAKLGNKESAFLCGMLDVFYTKNEKKGIKALKKLAKDGNNNAALYLGDVLLKRKDMLDLLIGSKSDIISWLQRACKENKSFYAAEILQGLGEKVPDYFESTFSKENGELDYQKAVQSILLKTENQDTIQLLSQAIEKNHPFAPVLLGRIAYQQNKFDKAAELFYSYMECTPYFNCSYEKTGWFDVASAYLRLLAEENISAQTFLISYHLDQFEKTENTESLNNLAGNLHTLASKLNHYNGCSDEEKLDACELFDKCFNRFSKSTIKDPYIFGTLALALYDMYSAKTKVIDKNNININSSVLDYLDKAIEYLDKIKPLKQSTDKDLENSKRQFGKICGLRGVVFHNQGKFSKAIQYYSKALEWDPCSPCASSLASLYVNGKSLLKGEVAYKKAIQILERASEQDGEAAWNLSCIYENGKVVDKAHEYRLKATMLGHPEALKNVENIDDVLCTKGVAALKNQQYDSAVLFFSSCSIKNVIAQTHLAEIYADKKMLYDPEKALEHIDKMLEILDEGSVDKAGFFAIGSADLSGKMKKMATDLVTKAKTQGSTSKEWLLAEKILIAYSHFNLVMVNESRKSARNFINSTKKIDKMEKVFPNLNLNQLKATSNLVSENGKKFAEKHLPNLTKSKNVEHVVKASGLWCLSKLGDDSLPLQERFDLFIKVVDEFSNVMSSVVKVEDKKQQEQLYKYLERVVIRRLKEEYEAISQDPGIETNVSVKEDLRVCQPSLEELFNRDSLKDLNKKNDNNNN